MRKSERAREQESERARERKRESESKGRIAAVSCSDFKKSKHDCISVPVFNAVALAHAGATTRKSSVRQSNNTFRKVVRGKEVHQACRVVVPRLPTLHRAHV